MLTTMSEDIETQRKGAIIIMWCGSAGNDIIIPGIAGSDKRVIVESGKTLGEASPVRAVAVHFWLPNTPLFRLAKSFYTFAAPVKSLARYKFHVGELFEPNSVTTNHSGFPFSFFPSLLLFSRVEGRNEIQVDELRNTGFAYS